MLPSLELLEQIQQKIQNLSNQRGESKQKIHYGCYLLGLKSGLRISEAIRFDLSQKTAKGLYRIEKTKGQKERLVYIPKQVISELKQNNWKPNHTNRFNFYHFLKKTKQKLNISSQIELTPHTLRRAFATYHAESGLPLPLLQKLLGHVSIRTTALYWRNIYGGYDSGDILTAKEWLTKPSKPKPIPENPIQISLEKLPEPITPNLFSEPLPNYLSKISGLEQQLNQTQAENNNLKDQNTNLQKDLNNLGERNASLHQAKNQAISEKNQTQQELTIAQETIQQLSQDLTNERNQKIALENNLNQTITNLNHQLQTEQQKNANLTQKLTQQEQNNTNLQNAYQKAIKNKAEKLVQAEKQNTFIQSQTNYYENQLKSIAITLHQWQKLNHYQKLEQQQNQFKPNLNNSNQILETKIIQPPLWKPK